MSQQHPYVTVRTENKYNRGRRLLKHMGINLPNYLNHTVYGTLARNGYCWDAEAKQWTKETTR